MTNQRKNGYRTARAEIKVMGIEEAMNKFAMMMDTSVDPEFICGYGQEIVRALQPFKPDVFYEEEPWDGELVCRCK